MKTIKFLLVALFGLFLASCSTDSVEEIDNGGVDTTETITTVNGDVVVKVHIETSWVLTERTDSNGTTSASPCGESAISTKVNFNSNGTATKTIISSTTCTPSSVNGSYEIDGSLLRTSFNGQTQEYDILSLNETSMSIAYDDGNEYTTMNYTDQMQSDDGSLIVTDEFFMGDWELVAAMVDNNVTTLDDRTCGARVETLTIHYMDYTTNNGLSNIFIVDGDCPNAIDETVNYHMGTYNIGDGDGYDWNNVMLTFYLNSGIEITYYVKEISFYDDNPQLAETMQVIYYDNGVEYSLSFERPF